MERPREGDRWQAERADKWKAQGKKTKFKWRSVRMQGTFFKEGTEDGDEQKGGERG